MQCIICLNQNNLVKICDCNYYVHKSCFEKWIELNNRNNCFYCNKKIKLDNKQFLLLKLKQILNFIYLSYSILCEYDLHNFQRWDEEFE